MSAVSRNICAALPTSNSPWRKCEKVQPNADYDHLTVVGHSAGADISMYFAKLYPDRVKRLVTLDNLRVPFMTDGRFKILSFRSKDPQFKTDPGVVPDKEICEKSGIEIVQTSYQHTWMSDRGPDDVKETMADKLDQFLDDHSPLKPVKTNPVPQMTDAGPVAPFVLFTPTHRPHRHRFRTDAISFVARWIARSQRAIAARVH